MMKKNVLASCVTAALIMSISANTHADKLQEIHQEEGKIHSDAKRSQDKVDALFQQSQELLVEYRTVVDQTENLKIYNDYLETLVQDQQRSIDSLQSQIDSIEETKQGIVPLMFRMIDSLEEFIQLDVPINLDERMARVDRLRDVMGNSNVTVSEQFRQVIEAYQIENEYGVRIQAYQGTLETQGTEVTVDFFNLGRTALLALSLDQTKAWSWNNDTRSWDELGSEYLDSVVTAVRMARNQVPADLIKLPINAAE